MEKRNIKFCSTSQQSRTEQYYRVVLIDKEGHEEVLSMEDWSGIMERRVAHKKANYSGLLYGLKEAEAHAQEYRTKMVADHSQSAAQMPFLKVVVQSLTIVKSNLFEIE